MGHSIADRTDAALVQRLENLPLRQAKADLKNLDRSWREQVGRAIQRAFSLAGITQKEAAALLNRDQAQVARWIAGAERPQIDALFSVEPLRQPLVVAFAELAGDGVEVITEIRVRRIA